MIQRRPSTRATATVVAAAAGLVVTGALAVAAGGAPVQNRGPVFAPVADALVTSARPRSNFGRARTLEVDRRPRVRSYLRFRIQGAGAVRSARLLLYVTRSRGGRYTVAGVRGAWSERRVTFRNAPRLGRTIASVAVAGPGWSEVDVRALVRGNGFVNLAITGPRGVVTFGSRESGARAPRLIVDSASPTDPVVAAAGNIACDPADPAFNGGVGTPTACRQRATSDLLVNAGLTRVLAMGDTQYECGGFAAFQQSYEPSWGRVKSITSPVPGNHDYRSPTGGTDCPPPGTAAHYFRYFGANAGEPGRGYYSFNIGAWHIVALNSFCEAVGGCGPTSPQVQWLRQDLAANRNFCTLAYFHHARFSSSFIQNRTEPSDTFWRVLAEAGADVVLGAHDHVYERFAPQDANGRASAVGTRQFVLGTGGRSLHPFFTIQPNSEVRNNTTFGVLRLTLRPASYDWQFVPAAGGSFTDSGSGSCH